MEKNDVSRLINTILNGTNYITWAHHTRYHQTRQKNIPLVALVANNNKNVNVKHIDNVTG